MAGEGVRQGQTLVLQISVAPCVGPKFGTQQHLSPSSLLSSLHHGCDVLWLGTQCGGIGCTALNWPLGVTYMKGSVLPEAGLGLSNFSGVLCGAKILPVPVHSSTALFWHPCSTLPRATIPVTQP